MYGQLWELPVSVKGFLASISVSQFGLLDGSDHAHSAAVLAFAGEAVVVLGVDLLVTFVVVDVVVLVRTSSNRALICGAILSG